MQKDVENVVAYRRTSPPRWPFVFRGLLPLLGLLVVAVFGITRSAGWVENTVQEGIRAELDANGFTWTQLEVSGRRARLSGSVPASGEGSKALTTARAATCPTWLGPRVCATRVSAYFGSWAPLSLAARARLVDRDAQASKEADAP